MGYMRDADGRRLDSKRVAFADETATVGGVSNARVSLPRSVATDVFGSAPSHPVILDSSSALVTNTNARIFRYSSGAWKMTGSRSPKTDGNGALYSKQTGCSSDYETVQWGCEFTAIGGDATNQFVEVGFALMSGVSTARLQIEENGKRYSTTIEDVTGLTGGSAYVLQLPLTSGTVKTFRVLGSRWRINYIRAPFKSIIQPVAPERFRIAVFGASFVADDYSWVQTLGRLTGAEVFQCGQAGSGIMNPGGGNTQSDAGVYNTTSRITGLAATNPDVIVIEMSGNDRSYVTDLTSFNTYVTAVKTFLAAINTALPGRPIIVCDVPPRGYTDTIANDTAWLLAGTRKAINESPTVNVVGYHDYLGTIVNTPTYTTGAAYAVGDRVVTLGAVWECTATVASAPSTFNTAFWRLFGWYTGTGRIGATTGNGTRDVLMGEGSDLTHPSAFGYITEGTVQTPDIQADIARNARVGTLTRAAYVAP